jgi:hypothetical protein
VRGVSGCDTGKAAAIPLEVIECLGRALVEAPDLNGQTP